MKKLIILIVTLIGSTGLSGQCINGSTGNQPGSEYTLVWQDEFDVDGAICAENWHHQTRLPIGGGWYNGEIQHYTNRTDNAYVQNGILNIVGKKETFLDQGVTKEYTSARLNSKFAFTYGKVEVRAKLPSGIGTWPAIWMLGKNINEDGGYWDADYGTTNWPACGEIDIMEHWGHNQNFVQSAMHTPSSSGSTINKGGQTISSVSTEFHIYQLEWTPEKMIFSVDDVVHYTYDPEIKDQSTWPFDADQYLLLNFAILPTIESEFVEDALEIDYVRIYQKDDYSITSPQQPAPSPQISSENIVSIFSDSYNDLPGTDFNVESGQSTIFSIETLTGDAMLHYSDLDFQYISLDSDLDVSDKSYIHLDLWTKDASEAYLSLLSAVGTSSEHTVSLSPIHSAEWNSYDIALSQFANGGVVLNAINQLKIAGQPGTTSELFIDNLYFYSTPSNQPVTGSSTPVPYQNVISLFSDSFNDVVVDTWQTAWSISTLDEVSLVGNNVKKYHNLNYAGIETVSNQIDINNMTHVHFDYWTPDASRIGFKLVDFGEDGIYSPQIDDSEHLINIDAPLTYQWVSVDLELADFTNLQNKKNIAQIILEGEPMSAATVFVDNVYFHDSQPANIIIGVSESATRDILCNNLTVSSGEQLVIPSGFSLTILEDMTVAGDLIVESGAALISHTNIVSGSVIVKRSTRYADGRYSFVGSPMMLSESINAVDLGSVAYQYDETSPYGADGLARWESIDSPLIPGKGYAQADNQEITFEGVPNAGTIIFQGSYTDRGDNDDGWNLIANPYPAAISVSDFISANDNITGSIYLWDDNSSNIERGNNDDYIVANALTYTRNSRAGSGSRYNGYIGSAQGFFVKLMDNSNVDITFSENMRRTHYNLDQNFFRQSTEKVPVIRVNLSGQDGLFKQTVLGMVPDADEQVMDRRYDAQAFGGKKENDFYSIKGQNMLAIQGIRADFNEVRLGFKVKSTGIYRIDIENEGFDGQELVLVDHETGKKINLLDDSYEFTVASQESVQDRFVLRFSSSVLSVKVNKKLFCHDNKLHILNPKSENLEVYTLSGRRVLVKEQNHDETIPLSLPSGVYIVRYGTETLKAVIR